MVVAAVVDSPEAKIAICGWAWEMHCELIGPHLPLSCFLGTERARWRKTREGVVENRGIGLR